MALDVKHRVKVELRGSLNGKGETEKEATVISQVNGGKETVRSARDWR